MARQANNRIRCLIHADGSRISDPSLLKSMILSYYSNLLGTVNDSLVVKSVSALQQILTSRCSIELQVTLAQTPSASTVKETVFRMARNRAPGPDGFPIDFYHHTWGITGSDLTSAVLEFFTTSSILREINATAITLIPKVIGAERLTDFRPLSCCNATYKIISTILSRRLKSFLSDAVQLNQAGFVKGRLLAENVLLASELVLDFHKSGPTKRGCLKVDLAKAYDNVNWEFILNILKALSVPYQLIHWIRLCITTPTYSVNVNGELVGFFRGSKGLRQGDPLSSSLFVLAMDVLSKMLDSAAASGRLTLHHSCKDPLITHLSFADDLLIFFDGSTSSLKSIMDVLDEFYSTSGLRINCEKTLLFLDGDNDEYLNSMCSEFGVTKGNLPVRYLGLPLSPRNIRQQDYLPLIDKIRQRLNSWRVRYLSFAGRLLLIKSVLSSIVNFWVSVFVLPKHCLNLLEKMFRSFLWKGNDSSTGGAKVAWSSVCTPKTEGGLGLRSLHLWNLIFSLKLVWLLFFKSGSLWVAWSKAHLLKGRSLWSAPYVNKGSLQWRKLVRLRSRAAEFLSCRLGSGEKASFWFDNWYDGGASGSSLLSRIGTIGPAATGIRLLSSVREAISNGQWKLSATSRNHAISSLRSILPLLPPSLNVETEDQYLWKSFPNAYSANFSTSKIWSLLRNHHPPVPWSKSVWINPCIPKHSFLFWIVVWRRLPTKDRLRRWGLDVNAGCVLCNCEDESLDHLLVICPFVQVLWSRFLSLTPRANAQNFQDILTWITTRSSSKPQLKIERLLVQAIIYEIWGERNARLHQRPHSTQAVLQKKILSTVRCKLFSASYSSTSLPLLQVWYQMFQPVAPS